MLDIPCPFYEVNKMSMQNKIEIRTRGVQSILKQYDFPKAIAEYVWNGFDANASEINIRYEVGHLTEITKFEITDNGDGIPYEALKQKFKPFLESEKAILGKINSSTIMTHGKKGVGRLTFFTFSQKAIWSSAYKRQNNIFEYEIEIDKSTLDMYEMSDTSARESKKTHTGTTVKFEGIEKITQESITGELKQFLKKEFAWFLELNKHKKFVIKINEKVLEYADLIGDSELSEITYTETGTKYNLGYIQWNERINDEYSKYYFIDSKGEIKYKEHTKLNKKGDHFYHSVFISSNYFDDFHFKSDEVSEQKSLLGGTKADKQYKYLQQELTNYLRKKRKPFLRAYADKLIEQYEKEKVFPEYRNGRFGDIQREDLENVVRGLYEVQPAIFSELNLEQKKTFLGFLGLVMDSDEREKVLEIVKNIVDLDPEEQTELLNLLKTSSLSRIIKTIKLIEDRYKIIYQLKELVFNKALKANEQDHLQEIIAANYWIFGEQYNLVTEAEPDFEDALRKFTYLLSGKDEKVSINHLDKNKEMDLFLCRQKKLIQTIENIVVELKHPNINLGMKEVNQVKTYMNVILQEHRFNGSNISWEFFLVGNEFDTSGYIEGEIESSKNHGELSLIHKNNKYKIYVKTWSEIFTDLECRFEFINEKLKLKKELLIKQYESADEIVKEATSVENTSALYTIPPSLK